MIASIRGKLLRKAEDFVILEQGGLGFHIDMAAGMVARLPAVGETLTVFTHLHVRENEMGLFGFTSEEEKNLFALVQTVSGVGPKLALQIVDSLTPEAFALAILQGDVDCLTSVKGIGRKGAARMILELTDKLKKAGFELAPATVLTGEEQIEAGDTVAEVRAALLVLGYSVGEAVDAIRRAGPEADDSVESLLRRALSLLALV